VDEVDDPVPLAYSGGSDTWRNDHGRAQSHRCLARSGEPHNHVPSIRAYCLPFAGGSASLFASWAEQVDDVVEVVPVELPGRGQRSDEVQPEEAEDDEAMLQAFADAILADLRGAQYVLVGFSLGGGLCMELALRLAARQAPLPLAVYIAGRRPPSLDPLMVKAIDMSDEELMDYAFVPEEVKQSPAFLEGKISRLRKDLELDARIERRLSSLSIGGSKLDASVGLEVYCGSTDDIAPWSEAQFWQRFAQAPIDMHLLPGGHEFLIEHRNLLLPSWQKDAIGRLLRQRSSEIALLAARSVSSLSHSRDGSLRRR